MINEGGLGKVVVAETAQGEFYSIGQVVAYSDQPTIVMRLPDGNLLAHWAASLTREATPTEIAIVQALAPAQNECFHDKIICGRLTYTKTAILCGRCKKAVEE